MKKSPTARRRFLPSKKKTKRAIVGGEKLHSGGVDQEGWVYSPKEKKANRKKRVSQKPVPRV